MASKKGGSAPRAPQTNFSQAGKYGTGGMGGTMRSGPSSSGGQRAPEAVHSGVGKPGTGGLGGEKGTTKALYTPKTSGGTGGDGRAPVTTPAGAVKGGSVKMVRPSPKGGGKTVPAGISGKRPAIAPALQPSAPPTGGVPGYKKGDIKTGNQGSGY